ncbi:MAG: hypothetical protein H6732_15835 [Alphaproteobacteria bacterium]|nr:hypothetical protein [Alphaproteobacteria bacterium]
MRSLGAALAVVLVACEGAATIDKAGLDTDLAGVDTDVGVRESPAPPPPDNDGDGYAADVDCNDQNPLVHPGAAEACNGTDDDCDAVIDQSESPIPAGLGPLRRDEDGDGYGGGDVLRWVCADAAEGWTLEEGDCDDTDADRHPGAVEVCNGVDDDCDDLVDDDDAGLEAADHPGAVQGYPDGDGDGFASKRPRWACAAPTEPWPTTPGADCADDDASTFPGAAEAESASACRRDHDEDGYGDAMPPAGVSAGKDCDDDAPLIHPGVEEVWYDGVDADCDGRSDDDADRDGHDAQARGGTDCDDTDPTIHPGATDIPIDGIDQDCSGQDAPCLPGDLEACPAQDCADVQAQRPGAPSGVYWILPEFTKFEAWCDMDHDLGGWTLVMVKANDNTNTFTWYNRGLWDNRNLEVGSIDRRTYDMRSRAWWEVEGTDLLFVHQPDGVWAAYRDVALAPVTVGRFVQLRSGSSGTCYGNSGGFRMTSGTIRVQDDLCSTDLFVSPQDQDGFSGCSNGANFTPRQDTWGFAWSADNTNGCPLDDPGRMSNLGPSSDQPSQEDGSVGFGRPLKLNVGAVRTRMEVYVR